LTNPLDLWKSRVVDGIVLWQLSAPPALVDAGCPLLSVGVESAAAWIAADEHGAGRQATEHLLALGHRRIGFVGARTSEHYGSYQRLLGYLDAMHDAGFPPQTAPVAVLTEEEGQAAAQHLLEQQTQLTALVAMNDLLASGSLTALRERGLRVLIAGAGLAAALPGVLAAHTDLPVIGVPLRSSLSVLDGLDALLSIVQMPPGVPVACVGVDNAKNAAVLAARILGPTASLESTQ